MSSIRSFASTVSLVVSALSLAACTNLLTPMGTDKYDCNRKQDPASPYCHSFRSVEKGTTGQIPDSRYDEVMRMSDYDRMNGIAPTDRPSGQTAQQIAATQPSSPSSVGARTVQTPSPAPRAAAGPEVPVRIGPLVQRVWVKRFVDANDMLVTDTRVYKEVIPAHWAGFAAPTQGPAAAPNARSAYPHRASDRASGPSAAKQPPDASKASTSEFVQPGTHADQADMANAPASPNGAPSLPQ